MVMTKSDSIFRRPTTGKGSGNGSYLAKPRSSVFYKTGANTAPAPRPRPAPAPTRSGGGGGSTYSAAGGDLGGGGGYAPAAAAAPARVSLRDFIDKDFGYKQAVDEYGDNGRRIREFDAETERGRGETERDQAVRREDLEQDMGEESLDAANSLAGRGLLRSGGLFLEQDKINRAGAQRRSAIDDLLANFLSQRGSGRIQQQQQGRSAINERINALTQQYQGQYGV